MLRMIGLVSLGFFLNLQAVVLILPKTAIFNNYGEDVNIKEKSILLNKEQTKQIAHIAQMKLTTKLYRAYIVTKDNNILGHAVLLNETVRSKNATVLYMLDRDNSIKAIEIVAFNEPPEYMPTNIWLKQFESKTNENQLLRVGKDIPTITGATLSARNIADGSRIALAIQMVVLNR